MTLHPDRDYELARIRFGINITDFGALTNFTVHKASIGQLLAESSLLFDSRRLKPPSYLDYIPSRYGLSRPITATTDCLLAKIRLQLYPYATSHDSELCTQLYCDALWTLQDALKDETKCLETDVLCATQLLSLHELLRPRGDSAWSHHVNGTARLMQLRSPARFTSELEKALFVSHVGPIATEAMLSNQRCYLAAPEWCAVYRSVAQESEFLTERSPLTIETRIGQVQITGIWQDVHDAVNSADLFDAVALAALETRCRRLHEHFLNAMDEYQRHFASRYPANRPLNELALRRELFGALIEGIAIVKRLISTLCDLERPTLEAETQILAGELLDLQGNPPPKHFLLFTGHEERVARSLIYTREQWEGAIAEGSERHFDFETQRLAVRLRYNAWNSMLR